MLTRKDFRQNLSGKVPMRCDAYLITLGLSGPMDIVAGVVSRAEPVSSLCVAYFFIEYDELPLF